MSETNDANHGLRQLTAPSPSRPWRVTGLALVLALGMGGVGWIVHRTWTGLARLHEKFDTMWPRAASRARRALWQHFDPRVADLDVAVAAAQFLEADPALAGAVLDGGSVRAVVAFDLLALLVQVEVQDDGSVEDDV